MPSLGSSEYHTMLETVLGVDFDASYGPLKIRLGVVIWYTLIQYSILRDQDLIIGLNRSISNYGGPRIM